MLAIRIYALNHTIILPILRFSLRISANAVIESKRQVTPNHKRKVKRINQPFHPVLKLHGRPRHGALHRQKEMTYKKLI